MIHPIIIAEAFRQERGRRGGLQGQEKACAEFSTRFARRGLRASLPQ
jgi:hypothetical protein